MIRPRFVPADRLLALLLGLHVSFSVAHGHEGLETRIQGVSDRIAKSPQQAALYLERAEYFRLQHEWRPALADLATAEQLDPGLAAVGLARGRLFVDAVQPERAVAEFDRFLVTLPDHAGAHALRAQALARLGRMQEAVADWDRAIALADPPVPEQYDARARLVKGLCPDGPARAVAGLDDGIRRLGGAQQLEVLALEIETEAGWIDAAVARLDRLARNHGGDGTGGRPERWLAPKARLLEAAGRDREARAAAEAALQAVARLPSALRHVPAMVELERELREQLTRLASTGEGIKSPCPSGTSSESRSSPACWSDPAESPALSSSSAAPTSSRAATRR